MKVCVDANLIAAIVLDEPLGAKAFQALASWADAELIAPDLWAYEVIAITHKAIRRGNLHESRRLQIIQAFFGFQVALLRPPELHEQASDLAYRLGLPAAYDAHYLALAQQQGVEFWTADERLYNAVHSTLPRVHFVGEIR